MTEFKRDANDLERRLRDHYQRRYEQPPDSTQIWARMQPQLDRQEHDQPGLLQRVQWLSGIVRRLAARQQSVLKERYKEHTFMDEKIYEEAIHIDQANTHDPRFTKNKPPLRRRVKHLVEAGLAAVLVAGLLLAWFGITYQRNTQTATQPVFTYAAQPGENVFYSQWLPDGQHLMIDMFTMATNRHRYLVWDKDNGKITQTFVITPPPDSSTAPGGYITDSLDGRYVIVRTYDAAKQIGAMELVNVLTGHIELSYQGHYDRAFPTTAISNDSKYVAFVSDDGHIRVWDSTAKKIILTSDPTGLPQIEQLSWSENGKYIIAEMLSLTPGQLHVVQEWSARSGHKVANIVATPSMFPIGGALPIDSFSPDGQRVLTANTQTGTFEIRESSTQKVLQTFHVQLLTSGSVNSSGELAGSYISPVWFANGERVFLEKDHQAYIWNAITGQLVATYMQIGTPGSTFRVAVARSGQGPYIALWQQGKPLEIKNVLTNATVSTIALTASPSRVYWFDNGRYINLGFNRDTQGKIYDTMTGRLIASYQGDYAVLSSDAKYIAVENDQSDPKTGRMLKASLEVLPVH